MRTADSQYKRLLRKEQKRFYSSLLKKWGLPSFVIIFGAILMFAKPILAWVFISLAVLGLGLIYRK